ncbi:hypothetical protein C8J57DRAFT_1538017 [Mycena rebaudengoi]|nr:hypothetical protein C8J57DRAFT_1538017 [Mycena rebaudengoi]
MSEPSRRRAHEPRLPPATSPPYALFPSPGCIDSDTLVSSPSAVVLLTLRVDLARHWPVSCRHVSAISLSTKKERTANMAEASRPSSHAFPTRAFALGAARRAGPRHSRLMRRCVVPQLSVRIPGGAVTKTSDAPGHTAGPLTPMTILPRRASSLQLPAVCAQNALIFDMCNYTAARVNPGQLMPSSPRLDLGCRSVLIDTALYHTPPAFTPMRRA